MNGCSMNACQQGRKPCDRAACREPAPMPLWLFRLHIAGQVAQDAWACFKVRRAAGFSILKSARIAIDAQLPVRKK